MQSVSSWNLQSLHSLKIHLSSNLQLSTPHCAKEGASATHAGREFQVGLIVRGGGGGLNLKQLILTGTCRELQRVIGSGSVVSCRDEVVMENVSQMIVNI